MEARDEEKRAMIYKYITNYGMITKTYDAKKAYRAQEIYCNKIHFPMFALEHCSCGADVFKRISVEEAGSRPITSCPSCAFSFTN